MNTNTSREMVFTTETLIPNVILDCITMCFCILSICKILILMILILIRRQLRKSKEKILFLLSINMYISIFIFTLFVLDMIIAMLKGHIHPNISETNNDTQWCRIKAYLTNVAMLSCLYSNTFHALYRFVRIIYYTRRFFYQNILLYILGIFIQIVLSTIQILPILLTNVYDYEDYHCQIPLTKWMEVLMGTVFIWFPPLFITITIYIYTVHYIRKNSAIFTLQQQTRITRDITVIKRIVLSVAFIVLCAMPAFSITMMYYLFGYYGWWGNHLAWLGFVVSFTGMSIVHTYYSPHLRIIRLRTPNRINHTAGTTLESLR